MAAAGRWCSGDGFRMCGHPASVASMHWHGLKDPGRVSGATLNIIAPCHRFAYLRPRCASARASQVRDRCALARRDLHQNRGYDSLRVMRKGGRRDALAINPQTAARLRAYLNAAGHATDSDGPRFRPLRHNGKQGTDRRHMDPDAIDRVVRKYAAALGLDRGYSAHSMRATFITTALENGAQLERGSRDSSTTKLYDRRAYNPEKAASFLATY